MKIGLMWDDYTPQVQSTIVRDLLSLSDEYDELSVVVRGKAKDLDGVLASLGLSVEKGKPDAWCFYRTKDDRPELPEGVDTYTRDLRQLKGGPHLTDRLVIPVAPQSYTVRPAPPSANPMNKPAPNPFSKPTFQLGSLEGRLRRELSKLDP